MKKKKNLFRVIKIPKRIQFAYFQFKAHKTRTYFTYWTKINELKDHKFLTAKTT